MNTCFLEMCQFDYCDLNKNNDVAFLNFLNTISSKN